MSDTENKLETFLINSDKQSYIANDNDLLTSSEVARFLQVSEPTIFRLRKCGKLKYYKIGNRILFSRQRHLKAFLDVCEQNVEPV